MPGRDGFARSVGRSHGTAASAARNRVSHHTIAHPSIGRPLVAAASSRLATPSRPLGTS